MPAPEQATVERKSRRETEAGAIRVMVGVKDKQKKAFAGCGVYRLRRVQVSKRAGISGTAAPG
jgi:hypothetical protein